MVYLIIFFVFLTSFNILHFLRRKQQQQELQVQGYYHDVAPLLEIYEIQALASEDETYLCFWAKDKRNGQLQLFYYGR
jgi:hypothetical protein